MHTTIPIHRSAHRAMCRASVVAEHARRLLEETAAEREYAAQQVAHGRMLARVRLSDRGYSGAAERILASHRAQADWAAAAVPAGASPGATGFASSPGCRSSAAAPPVICSAGVP